MSIQSFPKIFALGTDYIRDLFNEPVEISEKLDGSQLCWGVIDGQLHMRSKGAMLFSGAPQKMFSSGMSYIESIQGQLPEGMIFYAEYLQKPKHNTLTYSRIPKNHIALFGVMDVTQKMYPNIEEWAARLDIDHVPIIDRCTVSDATTLKAILDRESYLGGAKIEGIVIKNYHRPFLLGGQPIPLMCGKFVSESFKEVHRSRWGAEEKASSRMEAFMQSFRTHARWEKAVQHVRERGELADQPRDIGLLIKEIHADVEAEEADAIKEYLWREFKGEIMRKASAGVAEWYKEKLLDRSLPSIEWPPK